MTSEGLFSFTAFVLLAPQELYTRAAIAGMKAAMADVKEFVTSQQRDANRSLQPEIQARMAGGYTKVLDVPRGNGTFNRMKDAMLSHSSSSLDGIFTQACAQLMSKVCELLLFTVTCS